MYNGIKEDTQKMLDNMCAAIMEMRANGTEKENHIIALKLFTRESDEKTWCKRFSKGKYVRVIWSDNPERNDGYYDIWVEGLSALGIFDEVWEFVSHHIG